MFRNLKILGLILLALTPMSAIAAPKVSAQGGVTLVASQTGEASSNALTVVNLRVECPASTYAGHKYNVTPHALVPGGATTATLTPNYNQASCRANAGNFLTTIDMNGCDYVVHFGPTTGGVAGTFGLTFDVVCPAGKEIDVTMFTNATAHGEGKPFCLQHIPPQAGKAGLHATDTGNGHIDIAGSAEGIKVVETATTHPLLCPAKEITTGKLDLDLTVEGQVPEGETDISLSDEGTLQLGELTSGATLVASQTGEAKSNALTALGLTTQCPGSTYAGHKYNVTPHALVPSGATTATVTPSYNQASCTVTPGNFKATIDMNGCDYVVHFGLTTGGVAGTFGATFDVVCPAGKEIDVTMFTNATDHGEGKLFCLQHIPPQAGRPGLHATDTGDGHIDIAGSVESIKVVQTKGATHAILCPGKETTTGLLDLDLTVEGQVPEGETHISLSDEGTLQLGELTPAPSVTLSARETGEAGSNALTAFGLKLECPGSTYTGHKYNVTPHALVPSGATTATVTPSYNQASCRANPGNFPATIDMNGCDYVIHFGSTTGGVAGTFGATFDVVCPEGKEIAVTMFTNATTHGEGKLFCLQHIPPQAGRPGLHATDTGNGHIDIAGSVESIKVVQTKSATHAILCPGKETTSGLLDLDLTVEGQAPEGETDISLADDGSLRTGELT